MSVRSDSFQSSVVYKHHLWCEFSTMIQAHRHPNQRTPNDVRQRVIAAVLAGADMELAARMLSVKIWTVSAGVTDVQNLVLLI